MRARYSDDEPPLERKALITVLTSSSAEIKSPAEKPNDIFWVEQA